MLKTFQKYFSIVAPGILVAATGVGAGDLITASFAGNKLGVAVIWAPILGGIFKLVLTEGLARYQIATTNTLLQGWVNELGKWIQWLFLFYLVMWSYMVGGALINSCGAAMTALIPIGDLQTSKVIWGVLHSALGVWIALKGSFKFFEKIMSLLIGIMFVVVIFGSLLFINNPQDLMLGLIPSIPDENSNWLIGLIGGVGGTLTILSYGYWIREDGRESGEGLFLCKVDLSVAYSLTILFSIAMIIIGSQIDFAGVDKGQVSHVIGKLFESKFGVIGHWLFLFGFWAGVSSSLLGVWQSVPYLFADFRRLQKNRGGITDLSKSNDYRYYLFALAFIPISSLCMKFESIQLAYAVIGALFIPCLALSLLILNNSKTLPKSYQNKWKSNLVLFVSLLFFIGMGVQKLF